MHRDDLVRHARDAVDQVDQVAAEPEHVAALEAGQQLVDAHVMLRAHLGVDRGDLADSAVVDQVVHVEHGGIVAVHVAELHDEVLALRVAEHVLVGGDVFSARLIQVNVYAVVDAALCGGNAVQLIALAEDGVEPGNIKQLFFGHDRHIAVDLVVLDFFRNFGRFGHDTHDLKEVGKLLRAFELCAAVVMPRADVTEFNLFHICSP